MTTKHVSRGDTINFTAGSNIASGDVVILKHTIGVALAAIANGSTGAVALEGVFVVPKVTAAVFVVGEKLIWIAASSKFDDSLATPAAGDITGAVVAMIAGTASDTTATVKLCNGNATLT